MKRIGALALLVAVGACVAVTGSGIGGSLASGTYVWINGEGWQDYRVPDSALYQASMAVCARERIGLTSQGTSLIEGNLQSGAKVIIHIQGVNPGTSRLGIRVGPLGEGSMTAELHNKIGWELQARMR